jgi:ATP-grasp domain, R2K clade family 3
MKPALILFPHEPFSPRKVDSVFAGEFDAARMIGFPTGFYDHEATAQGDAGAAVNCLDFADVDQRLILRGWMIPGDRYAALYTELMAKGYQPQTSPEAYSEAHYIPISYQWTKGHSPRTGWIEGDDADKAWLLYQSFKAKDAIIKDWVKSAKTRWKDGCFIPAETTEQRFMDIYRVFREERGKLFNRGVVLREFMPIVERGSDIRGLPIIEETRLFFWEGRLLVAPSAIKPSPLDELPRWEMIAKCFASPFITIDVAHLTDGTWSIVEVGDGGVSSLPIGLDPERFFGALWNQTIW